MHLVNQGSVFHTGYSQNNYKPSVKLLSLRIYLLDNSFRTLLNWYEKENQTLDFPIINDGIVNNFYKQL